MRSIEVNPTVVLFLYGYVFPQQWIKLYYLPLMELHDHSIFHLTIYLVTGYLPNGYKDVGTLGDVVFHPLL